LAFSQRFVQRSFGLLQGDARAAAINLLAGKPLGGDFDICRQQHHISVGNRRGAQRSARTDRTLGFHLQVIAQALGRLLQGFSCHKGMSDASRARGHGNQPWRALADGDRLGNHLGRDIDLRLLGTASQHRFDVLQRLSRRALEHSLADKTQHIHRRAADHQHPLGGFYRRSRQLTFRMSSIMHFDTGAPALALRRSIKQTRAEYAGDHAVRAGCNNG
jgi:hypothetical protein